MLFNSDILIYQPTATFEHGEVSNSYEEVGTLFCHIKFTGNEQQSGDRKKAIRRARLHFEQVPVTLSARNVVAIGDAFYYLMYTPIPRVGLGGRTIYEVDIIEDFKGEVSV